MSDIGQLGHGAAPRVRDQARDVAALALFSAGVSGVLTLALLVVVRLGGQA
jgi:hypothetical protein